MYLQDAMARHHCVSDASTIRRLRRLAYKSLRTSLTDSGGFRSMVETMLNERPELLAQLLGDVYYGKTGDFTDWKYLHKLIVTQAYPTKARWPSWKKRAKRRLRAKLQNCNYYRNRKFLFCFKSK